MSGNTIRTALNLNAVLHCTVDFEPTMHQWNSIYEYEYSNELNGIAESLLHAEKALDVIAITSSAFSACSRDSAIPFNFHFTFIKV